MRALRRFLCFLLGGHSFRPVLLRGARHGMTLFAQECSRCAARRMA
jgi:hypothetical protein